MKDMKNEFRHIVMTQCMTYNHAPYIVDALNGFCIQETSFPVVYVIIDDASKDGEQDVLKKYMQNNFDLSNNEIVQKEETDDYYLIFAQHNTNKNCYFAVYFLKYNHYSIKKSKRPYYANFENSSKYIALCEGDDYWTDPLKLQKQVDFMENHTDYVMCYTDHGIHGGGYRNHNVYIAPDDYYFPYSITNGFKIGTLTVLFRTDVYDKLPKHWVGKRWPMGDKPLWIELSRQGKIKFIPVITAHYRMSFCSASHSSLENDINGLVAGIEIDNYYAKVYGIQLPNNGYNAGFYISVMKTAFRHRNKTVARKYYNEAKVKNKLSFKLLILYFATIVEPFGELLSWMLKGYYIRPVE